MTFCGKEELEWFDQSRIISGVINTYFETLVLLLS